MVFGSLFAMRGWMRWKRETPFSSSTAISPSSTACVRGEVVMDHGQFRDTGARSANRCAIAGAPLPDR